MAARIVVCLARVGFMLVDVGNVDECEHGIKPGEKGDGDIKVHYSACLLSNSGRSSLRRFGVAIGPFRRGM